MPRLVRRRPLHTVAWESAVTAGLLRVQATVVQVSPVTRMNGITAPRSESGGYWMPQDADADVHNRLPATLLKKI